MYVKVRYFILEYSGIQNSQSHGYACRNEKLKKKSHVWLMVSTGLLHRPAAPSNSDKLNINE